jgi:hypothetical protein
MDGECRCHKPAAAMRRANVSSQHNIKEAARAAPQQLAVKRKANSKEEETA